MTTAESDKDRGVDALVDGPEMAGLSYGDGWRDGVRYGYALSNPERGAWQWTRIDPPPVLQDPDECPF